MADCLISQRGIQNKNKQYHTDNLISTLSYGLPTPSSLNGLNISLNNSFTIEMYGSYSSIPSSTGKGRLFVLRGSSSDIVSYSLYNDLFEIKIGNTWFSNDATSIVLPVNEKHTITTVVNNTIVQIYLDGVLITTLNDITLTTTQISYIYLLQCSATADRTTRGTIDSLRLYNKALTEEEIVYNHKVDILKHGE